MGRALFVYTATTITLLALLADGFQQPSSTRMVAPQISFVKRTTRIRHKMNMIPLSSISNIIYSRKISSRNHQCLSGGLLLFREKRDRDMERFNTSTKKPVLSVLKNYMKQIYATLYRKSRFLQRFIRAYTERYTIYVLECENGKFYVGSTRHRKQRLRQHLTSRGGSSWTRQHKPIRVTKEYKRVPELHHLGLEAKVTAECMLEYGVNNVRGAMFALTRDYTVADLDALTGFLGHYNNLNYRELNMTLSRTLPQAELLGGGNGGPKRSRVGKKSKVRRDKNSPSAGDRCHNCGERGHWAANCTNQRMSRSDDVCYNCGVRGHWALDCPNQEESRVEEYSEYHQPLSKLFVANEATRRNNTKYAEW
jgi:hypothetical protein